MIRATLWSFLRSFHHGSPIEQDVRPLEHTWRMVPVRLRLFSGTLHGFGGNDGQSREEKQAPDSLALPSGYA